MKLNEKIKNARKAAGLTQYQIAEKLGIFASQYQMYEYGTRRPRLNMLIKIAEACGVGLDYFGDDVNSVQINSKKVAKNV